MTERWDVVDYLQGGRTPEKRTVHTTCPVPVVSAFDRWYLRDAPPERHRRHPRPRRRVRARSTPPCACPTSGATRTSRTAGSVRSVSPGCSTRRCRPRVWHALLVATVALCGRVHGRMEVPGGRAGLRRRAALRDDVPRLVRAALPHREPHGAVRDRARRRARGRRATRSTDAGRRAEAQPGPQYGWPLVLLSVITRDHLHPRRVGEDRERRHGLAATATSCSTRSRSTTCARRSWATRTRRSVRGWSATRGSSRRSPSPRCSSSSAAPVALLGGTVAQRVGDRRRGCSTPERLPSCTSRSRSRCSASPSRRSTRSSASRCGCRARSGPLSSRDDLSLTIQRCAVRRSRRSCYRRFTLGALLLLAAIVVSGAAVRLTGSGLGCPDWPNCDDGRLVAPFEKQAMIEFTNRTITGLVSVAVILAVLGSIWRVPRRRRPRVALLGPGGRSASPRSCSAASPCSSTSRRRS